MKTRFQTSSQRSHSHSTPRTGAARSLLGAGELVALEVVDLGAGAAGAGVAHGPEVVLHPELEDAVRRDVSGPEARAPRRLAGSPPSPWKIVTFSRSSARPSVFGQELPAERDRVLLEVVAEREVAEHLEERVVAGRDAHVLEVVVLAAGPDALLGGGGAGVGRASRARGRRP